MTHSDEQHARVIHLRVWLAFDPEAQVWYVDETELPGLVLEDADPDRLEARLREAAPELAELNRDALVQAQGLQPGDKLQIVCSR